MMKPTSTPGSQSQLYGGEGSIKYSGAYGQKPWATARPATFYVNYMG